MSNLTISDVNSAIMYQNWTNDELMTMYQAVKYAREKLTKRNVWSLTVGAEVKFTNSRTGRVHVGKVTKINRKRVIVREGMTNWTVPAAMLSAA
jgi:hypothetical protein